MGNTGRVALGAIAGVVLWSVLWLGGNAVAVSATPDLIATGERVDHLGVLLGYLGWSMILSVLAGYVTAALAGTGAMRTVWILAFVLLAMGIFFEMSSWDLTPTWYHVVFLALLVPMTVLGGRMKVGGRAV